MFHLVWTKNPRLQETCPRHQIHQSKVSASLSPLTTPQNSLGSVRPFLCSFQHLLSEDLATWARHYPGLRGYKELKNQLCLQGVSDVSGEKEKENRVVQTAPNGAGGISTWGAGASQSFLQAIVSEAWKRSRCEQGTQGRAQGPRAEGMYRRM